MMLSCICLAQLNRISQFLANHISAQQHCNCPLSTFIAQHCCCTKSGAWQLGYISFSTRLYQIGFLCSQSSGFVLSRLQLWDFFHGFNAVILLTQQPFNSPKCNHQHHRSKLPSTSFSSSSSSSAYSTKMINFSCNLFLILV